MKYIISTVILIWCVISCTPPIVFDKAYPSSANNLLELPMEYQGAFICESDSTVIIINKNSIANRKEQFFRLSLKNVDEKENCMISGDKMYVDDRKECIPIIFESDSVVRGTVIEVDTFFKMVPGSIARLHKGHVVISQEVEDGLWAINLLTLQDNGDIVYRAITDKTEIRKVSSITPAEQLSGYKRNGPKYKVKPTMAEFDDMINDDKVFITCDYLTRINLEQEYIFIN